MARCDECVCYFDLGGDGTRGECHYAPPLPVGDYKGDTSSPWPIVLASDECAQHFPGAHAGTTCVLCTNYSDGVCKAIPPTPVGEYKGDVSLWPLVLATDYSCCACFNIDLP